MLAQSLRKCEGAAFAAPFVLREVERPSDMPRSLPPVCGWRELGSRDLRSREPVSRALSPQLAAGAVVRSNARAFYFLLGPRAEDDQREDDEADAAEQQRDPDDEPEQCDLLGHVADVQRGRERGLCHPGVAGGVRDRAPEASLGAAVSSLVPAGFDGSLAATNRPICE